MVRLQITLTEEEADALAVLGELEMRDPRQQVRQVLREALEKRGLLASQEAPSRCAGAQTYRAQ